MGFRNPVTGGYVIVNGAFMRDRASRSTDPRCEFYKAILSSESFEQYYAKVGSLVVQPDTTSKEVNADMEVKYALKQRWLIRVESDGDEPSRVAGVPDLDRLDRAVEGRPYFASHLKRERNRALVEAKKNVVLREAGALSCEACGFDFHATYGDLGAGFCEVHHLAPLSSVEDSVTTSLDELAILCSNCHRIIHRSDPMLSVPELRAVLWKENP